MTLGETTEPESSWFWLGVALLFISWAAPSYLIDYAGEVFYQEKEFEFILWAHAFLHSYLTLTWVLPDSASLSAISSKADNSGEL
jgi:hypothetical protein